MLPHLPHTFFKNNRAGLTKVKHKTHSDLALVSFVLFFTFTLHLLFVFVEA